MQSGWASDREGGITIAFGAHIPPCGRDHNVLHRIGVLAAASTDNCRTLDQRATLDPIEENPTAHNAGGAGFTLIAAAGIGILWLFVWKLMAITLQYLFVSGTSSRAFPVVSLSFAISVATMCVVVLLVRDVSRRPL